MLATLVACLSLALLIPSSKSAEVSCADIWDSTSTSTCTVDTDFINDDDCDCDGCEDEQYWTCDTCREGCSSFCSFRTCTGGDSTGFNLRQDCNFYLSGGLPIVEGECFSASFSIPGFGSSVRSSMMECVNTTAIVTHYNDSDDCTLATPNGMYYEYPNAYSCGGTADACDAFTVYIDQYFGNETNVCDRGSRLFASAYAVVPNLGCVDDTDYTISTTGGIDVEYYFGSDGTCSGNPSGTFEQLVPGCNIEGGFAAYLTIEGGVVGSPDEPSPHAGAQNSASNYIVNVVAMFLSAGIAVKLL